MKALFCPNCRRKVDPPKFLRQVNIQGNVNIQCGHCNPNGKGNPKGVVKIKGKKQEEVQEVNG